MNSLDKLHRYFQWLEYFLTHGLVEDADVVVNMIVKELEVSK